VFFLLHLSHRINNFTETQQFVVVFALSAPLLGKHTHRTQGRIETSSFHIFTQNGILILVIWLNKKMKISLNTFFAKRHINFNQSVVSVPTYSRTIQFVTMILPPAVVITSCGLIWPPVYTAPGPLWDLINGGSRRTFVFIHNLGPPA
jgi:hypothetical protein